jgi:hypothetical protein
MHLRWIVLAGAMALASAASGRESLPMRHAHGLGYSADGARILIPGHQGIMVHGDGRWSIAPGPERDFMGFAVTRDSIFTSGHLPPGGAAGASLGLLRSGDGGLSWTSMGLEDGSDFHVVGAGYESNALYVYNAAPRPLMPQAGLYRVTSDGPGGRSLGARGMRGETFMLAVHPTDESMVAAVTSEGLFLSRNGGEDFEALIAGGEPRAVYFALDGGSLWLGTFAGTPGLFRMDIASGAREEIALPAIGRDAVAYIAQNPVHHTEFAIVTFERAVFVTPDRGTTWTRIARARGTLPQE